MGSKYKPHDAVRVKSGEMAGMVGTVLEVKEGTRGDRVRVEFAGIRNGEAFDKALTFDAAKLEHAA